MTLDTWARGARRLRTGLPFPTQPSASGSTIGRKSAAFGTSHSNFRWANSRVVLAGFARGCACEGPVRVPESAPAPVPSPRRGSGTAAAGSGRCHGRADGWDRPPGLAVEEEAGGMAAGPDVLTAARRSGGLEDPAAAPQPRRGHAALAAGLRAAHGGLPGRRGLLQLRDPLPRPRPQRGRGGGHHRAAGRAEELELHVWPAVGEGDWPRGGGTGGPDRRWGERVARLALSGAAFKGLCRKGWNSPPRAPHAQ